MNDKYSFENFIMQCCKAKEWELRKFLKRVLTHAGFEIQEDNYRSHRDGKYSTIRNMIAIRGNPRVCLVAHTDVCRDHAFGAPDVDPVIKIKSIKDEMRSIIQDRDCSYQVGGDDRLGVAINTWIALNTGYDLGLLFTTDEEVGLVSAEYVKFPELLKFDILLQVDRGNHSNQLVTSIAGYDLCSEQTARRLIQISHDIGLPRYRVNGMMTDVLAIKTNHMCQDAVNMTCGYHNSIGADRDEYIDIQESKDTLKYVSSIIQYYDLGKDKDEEPEDEAEEYEEEEDLEQLYLDSISDDPRAIERMERYRNSRRGRGSSRRHEDLWSEESYRRDRGEHYDDEFQEYRSGWDRFIM